MIHRMLYERDWGPALRSESLPSMAELACPGGCIVGNSKLTPESRSLCRHEAVLPAQVGSGRIPHCRRSRDPRTARGSLRSCDRGAQMGPITSGRGHVVFWLADTNIYSVERVLDSNKRSMHGLLPLSLLLQGPMIVYGTVLLHRTSSA